MHLGWARCICYFQAGYSCFIVCCGTHICKQVFLLWLFCEAAPMRDDTRIYAAVMFAFFAGLLVCFGRLESSAKLNVEIVSWTCVAQVPDTKGVPTYHGCFINEPQVMLRNHTIRAGDCRKIVLTHSGTHLYTNVSTKPNVLWIVWLRWCVYLHPWNRSTEDIHAPLVSNQQTVFDFVEMRRTFGLWSC